MEFRRMHSFPNLLQMGSGSGIHGAVSKADGLAKLHVLSSEAPSKSAAKAAAREAKQIAAAKEANGGSPIRKQFSLNVHARTHARQAATFNCEASLISAACKIRALSLRLHTLFVTGCGSHC